MANKNEYSLRWEQDGMSWLGFTDGALFCHVFCGRGDGWSVQNHFAVDESKEFDDGFITAEQAKGFGEKLYQEWLEEIEAHIEELELILDADFQSFMESLLEEAGPLYDEDSGPVFDDLEDDDE